MRAWEFINESATVVTKTGIHPPEDQEAVMPGAYRMGGSNDKLYELLMLMRRVAGSNGKTMPPVPENWVGLNDTANPYTKVEADMLRMAFKDSGIEWQDALAPNFDNRSIEPTGGNKVSPIKGFAGYIKKTKKKKSSKK